MTFVFIIFIVSVSLALGMVFLRAWRIRTVKNQDLYFKELEIPQLPFRHLEKNVLYLTKYLIQNLILFLAKYWFVLSAKFKKWFNEKWPKINSFFTKKTKESKSYRQSFFKKAVLESKARIKHLREKVKKEIDVQEEN